MANQPACLPADRLWHILCRPVSPSNNPGKKSQLYDLLRGVQVLAGRTRAAMRNVRPGESKGHQGHANAILARPSVTLGHHQKSIPESVRVAVVALESESVVKADN